MEREEKIMMLVIIHMFNLEKTRYTKINQDFCAFSV